MIADQPRRWPVTRHERLAPGRVCDFVEEDVTTPSGEQITRQFITHPGAVAIIPWDEERDEVACVHQYRHPVGLELVEIPAGLLDVDGEEPWSAARRELAEETELQAERWDVLVDVCTSPGGSAELLRVFLARGLSASARPEGFQLEGEEAHMQVEWVPRPELVEGVLAGRLQSPSLVFGLLALEAARADGRLDRLRPPGCDWPARR